MKFSGRHRLLEQQSASPKKTLIKAGIINLDEFDKISEKHQPDLKNLLLTMSVPVHRGKQPSFRLTAMNFKPRHPLYGN